MGAHCVLEVVNPKRSETNARTREVGDGDDTYTTAARACRRGPRARGRRAVRACAREGFSPGGAGRSRLVGRAHGVDNNNDNTHTGNSNNNTNAIHNDNDNNNEHNSIIIIIKFK